MEGSVAHRPILRLRRFGHNAVEKWTTARGMTRTMAAKKDDKDSHTGTIAVNRRARHEYFIDGSATRPAWC
jgi:hypothetical protein